MNRRDPGTTLKIAQTSSLTFACYLLIGIQFATVPEFVNKGLGYSPVVAGLAVSIQYVATLVTRPVAGRMSDTKGAKSASCLGLVLCLASALLMIPAAALAGSPFVALLALMVCRLLLGLGESLVATGSALWGLERVGPQHTAQVLAWNGIASYGAVAVGAPMGAFLAGVSPYAIGVASAAISVAGLAGALRMAGSPPKKAPESESIAGTLRGVFPYGMALALGGAGFGMISAFTTLFYADQHWARAGLALSIFGGSLALVRLTMVNAINRFGGLRVATFSLATKATGLIVIALAPAAIVAKAGAALAGAGFSLVYPSLGVEAVRRTPPEKRGAVLGLFSAFWDLSLGASGPIGGVVATYAGYRAVFGVAAVLVLCGAGITIFKLRKDRA